jgi:hypothetical protein
MNEILSYVLYLSMELCIIVVAIVIIPSFSSEFLSLYGVSRFSQLFDWMRLGSRIEYT